MPPGPFFQKLNAKLHQEPWSSLTYGLFWIFTLTSSWVLVVSALLGRTVSQLLIHLLFPGASKAYDPSNSETNASYDMAVVITGCDSGFGRDLALRAADMGFTVFAGCLDPKANGNTAADMAKLTKGTIYPLPMNVTSDEQVAAAASAVSTWLKGCDDKGEDAPAKRRVLHALVNNAGIGVGGLVDWTDVTFFQQSIDGT
jgi:short chain dehydrogenase